MNNINWKSTQEGSRYGDLIGNREAWLASTGIDLYSDNAVFKVFRLSRLQS